MGRASFHISGVTRRTLRRWARHARPGIAGSPLMLAVLSIGGFLVLGNALPDLVAMVSGDRHKIVCGVGVVGRRLALVVDTSGSMNEERRAILQRLRLRLAESGMSIADGEATGMGVAENGSNNLMKSLREDFGADTALPDAIIVLSDFEVSNNDYWASDAAGHAALTALLERLNARLYLGTVEFLPSEKMPELMRIAERSGGGEINFGREAQGDAACI